MQDVQSDIKDIFERLRQIENTISTNKLEEVKNAANALQDLVEYKGESKRLLDLIQKRYGGII